MASENGTFSYKPTTSGIYTWNFRMKNSGTLAQPASVCYLDNLVASYPIPYTRIDCDKGPNASYRFGFNGQEKVDEVYGAGNLNTALFWEYDTRFGRRWNVDPLPKTVESPYATFAKNSILFADIKGDSGQVVRNANGGSSWQGQVTDQCGKVVNGTYSVSQMQEFKYSPLLNEVKVGKNINEDAIGALNQMTENPYSRYNPDASGLSFSLNMSALTYYFSFNFGFATERANCFGSDDVLFGGIILTNSNSLKPGVIMGLNYDCHDNLGDGKDVLGGIGGKNFGNSGSAILGGSYSYSIVEDPNSRTGYKKQVNGVETKSLSLGIGFNANANMFQSKVIRFSDIGLRFREAFRNINKNQ